MSRRKPRDPDAGNSGYQHIHRGPQVWSADFIDDPHTKGVGIDRRDWPGWRDLFVEVIVRKGEMPAEVVFATANACGLVHPFLGQMRRIS
jgi:hypothetical protein